MNNLSSDLNIEVSKIGRVMDSDIYLLPSSYIYLGYSDKVNLGPDSPLERDNWPTLFTKNLKT